MLLFNIQNRKHYLIRVCVFEILYKISILIHWLRGKRNGVSTAELLKFLFLTTRFSIGLAKIKKIIKVGKYVKIYLKEFKFPLYFPAKGCLPMLYIVLGENLSPENWHYYEIENKKIDKNDIVVDCGATVGTFTIYASQKAKHVYAIEPFSESLELLRRSFSKVKNVSILPYAVGSSKRKAYMTGDTFGMEIHKTNKGESITITTIDDLFFKKGIQVAFLKADLEGYEMEMLKGAMNTIKSYKPKLAITTYHKQKDPIEIVNFIKQIVPSYTIVLRGIERKYGNPVMLHAY